MKTLVTSLILLVASSALVHAQSRRPQPGNSCASKHLAVGDRIIDENNYEGTINAIYGSQQARVGYRQGDGRTDYHMKDTRRLTPSVQRLRQHNVGEQIMDENNYEGRIERLYADGRTFVAYPQSDGRVDYHLKNIASLAVSVRELGGFYVGDGVTDENNYHGYVERMYSDGRVKVAYPQANGRTDYHWKRVTSLVSDNCSQ